MTGLMLMELLTTDESRSSRPALHTCMGLSSVRSGTKTAGWAEISLAEVAIQARSIFGIL